MKQRNMDITELRESRNRKAVLMAKHLFECFDEWQDDHKYAERLKSIVRLVLEGVPFFDTFGLFEYQILELTAHEYDWKYYHNDVWAIATRTQEQRRQKRDRLYRERSKARS